MKIAGYLKTSLLDWPGEVSSVIWTQGCNFACPFCHNRDLVSPEGKDLISEDELVKSLKQRKKWVDHLVITGGEPTIQSDLVDFCQKIKTMGFKIKMDTNGSRPEVVKRLMDLNLVDYWAMDVKTQLENYSQMAKLRITNDELIKKIKESLKLIVKSGKDYEFRTTVVPGIHNEEVMEQMAREMREIIGGPARSYAAVAGRWYWQKFVGRNCVDPRLDGTVGVSKREINSWKKGIGVAVGLRGW